MRYREAGSNQGFVVHLYCTRYQQRNLGLQGISTHPSVSNANDQRRTLEPSPHLQVNQGGTTLWTPTFVASTFESDSVLPTRRRRQAARTLADLEAPPGPTYPRVKIARASSTFRRTRLLEIYEHGGWTVVAAVVDRRQQRRASRQHHQSCLPPTLLLEPAVNSGRRGGVGGYLLGQRYQGGVDLSRLLPCAMESKRAIWEERR